MNICIYRLKVSHDGGTFWVRTSATSERSAVESVCRAENCPKSAILEIRRIKRIYGGKR